LEKLKENRNKHKADYDEAVANYRVAAKEALRAVVKKIDKGEDFNLSFQLPEPREFLSEYDRAIGMLEMSVDELVELEEHEFDQLVNDSWPWAHQFAAATSFYNGPRRR
jgi:hypothetical protein